LTASLNKTLLSPLYKTHKLLHLLTAAYSSVILQPKEYMIDYIITVTT
jgi:hypothetical protein